MSHDCNCNNDLDSLVLVGDQVPQFNAPVYMSETKSIDSYTFKAGKFTVLYFYPADFTFV